MEGIFNDVKEDANVSDCLMTYLHKLLAGIRKYLRVPWILNELKNIVIQNYYTKCLRIKLYTGFSNIMWFFKIILWKIHLKSYHFFLHEHLQLEIWCIFCQNWISCDSTVQTPKCKEAQKIKENFFSSIYFFMLPDW